MEMKWIKVAYLQLKNYKYAIDVTKNCEDIDKSIIQIAWKRFGVVFVMPRNPDEPLSRINIRKPTHEEWENLVLYAREKCKQLDPTYFLKDPDPMSRLNGVEYQLIYTTEGK